MIVNTAQQEPIKVYELARQLKVSSKRILDKLSDVNIFKKTHMAYITPDELKVLFKHIGIINEGNQEDEILKEIEQKIFRYRPRIVKTSIITNTETNTEQTLVNSRSPEKLYEGLKKGYIDSDNVSKKVQMIYNAIELTRKEYGDFKKCELHLHTPASHDYALHSAFRKSENNNNGEYYNAQLEDLIELLAIYNIYSPEDMKEINKNIEYLKSAEYSQYLKEKDIPYDDFKEEIAYLLLAQNLYVNKIHLAIVTDHNTINGYSKLNYAIKEYYSIQEGSFKHYVNVFLGVEISCSDGYHIVGIFDERDIKDVDAFVNDIISNQKDGTYYPSIYVIEKIFDIGGIAYIAHINSSELLGNKPSKEKLFNISDMRIIGLTNKESKQSQIDRISHYANIDERDFCFVYESDAHTIDEIGKKNTWIKFNEVNFKALKKAIEDHGICIKMEEPRKSYNYIKGILVSPGEFGFLKYKHSSKTKYSGDEFFSIFSQDLNCIIGGRGTGKTTLINIIDLCFSQQIYDVRLLDFISKNKEIVIVFCLKGVDYVLRFIPQVKGINDDGTVEYFEDAFDSPFFRKKDYFRLSDNWYEFYQVIKIDNMNSFKKITGNKIINEFYRRGYSINELVGRIKNGTISDYIRSIVLYGLGYNKVSKEITNLRRINDVNVANYLSQNLDKLQRFIEEQSDLIRNKLTGFNNAYLSQLQILYKNGKSDADGIVEIFSKELSGRQGEKFIANTYLQWNEVVVYLRYIIRKIGYLEFLHLLFNKKYLSLEEHVQISKFVEQDKLAHWMVETGRSEISDKNINNIYDEIKSKLVITNGFLRKSVLQWIQNGEEFSLLFNINNKETIHKSKVYLKDLHELSMGQKVSALLAFVFNYGKYANDNTPLIIDQPEDNLDNQYIYKNLIKSLRNIKNERQVIIVTHCSAIVTNADAEHVIVLDSDCKNGWLSASGYATNEKITTHIINFMEGGVESLRNKIRKYSIFNDKLKI